MPCKLDHSDPYTIPQALCHACMTPEQREAREARLRALYSAIFERHEIARKKANALREITLLRERNARNAKRNPEPGSIAHKILQSNQRKLERLEHEYASKYPD